MRDARAWLAVGALLSAGASCHSQAPSSPETPSASEVVLSPGETAQVQGLAVKFDGVSADSRCPLGVTCVWEGDAVVIVTASQPPAAGSAVELHTSGRFPQEGAHGRYRIELVSLAPQPREGEAVPPAQYRATLRISTP
jgi:hypothetical protein